MKKQKICVIGDGLSGLTAALVLSNLDIDVDFITKNKQEKKIVSILRKSVFFENLFLNYFKVK